MPEPDQLYEECIAACGPALRRLVTGYEMDPDLRRDLLQEIHIELWRSFRLFDGRCNLKTWAYRVAHNVGASHVLKRRRATSGLVELETLEAESIRDHRADAGQQHQLSMLLAHINRLKPADRQIMLLYLEGETAESIAETTGTTGANVAVKIHRIKKVLADQIGGGKSDAAR